MGSQAALREAQLQPPEVAGLRVTETGLLEPNLLDLRARSWEAAAGEPGCPGPVWGHTESAQQKQPKSHCEGLGRQATSFGPPTGTVLGKGGRLQKTELLHSWNSRACGVGEAGNYPSVPTKNSVEEGCGLPGPGGLARAWHPHQRGPRYREQKPMLWEAAPQEQVPQPSTMGAEGASEVPPALAWAPVSSPGTSAMPAPQP